MDASALVDGKGSRIVGCSKADEEISTRLWPIAMASLDIIVCSAMLIGLYVCTVLESRLTREAEDFQRAAYVSIMLCKCSCCKH